MRDKQNQPMFHLLANGDGEVRLYRIVNEVGMKDVASEKYQKEFFPLFFKNWGADFYAIIGEEVYHGESE